MDPYGDGFSLGGSLFPRRRKSIAGWDLMDRQVKSWKEKEEEGAKKTTLLNFVDGFLAVMMVQKSGKLTR